MYIGDFASGMSSIAVGIKPKATEAEDLATKKCATIDEADDDLDDINIIDI